MAAKYEGHSDDDVVFLFLFFFQRDIITSPGYRGRNRDCDEDEGKLMAVKSSTVTACVLYTGFMGPQMAGTHIQHARSRCGEGNAPRLRGSLTDRQCKGHVIKKKKKLLENQSNIKDFNSKSLTPSEMMKSQTSPNCLVNHSNQPKEENINKG